MTRSQSRRALTDNFTGCIVRIKQKKHLEKLRANRRAIKIAARRKTITLDNVAVQAPTNCNILFKKIATKPFQRRSSGHQMRSVSSGNNVLAGIHPNGKSNPRAQPVLSNTINSISGENRNSVSAPKSNNPANIGNGNNAVVDDINKENHSPCPLDQLILPCLPSVESSTFKDSIPFSSPILDMIVPNSLILPVPLNPLIGYSTSILDQAIPSNGIDLPSPLIPSDGYKSNSQAAIKTNSSNIDSEGAVCPPKQRSMTNRSIPSLLPICDMVTSQQVTAKKMSMTSQLIIDTLDQFETSRNVSTISNTSFPIVETSTEAKENITFSEVLDESDEFFGRLIYDGDSE